MNGKGFVEDWYIIQTLGEGAYGEVSLLVNQYSNQTVAVKEVNFARHKDAKVCVTKEERIHRQLKHPNIIQYYGKREEPEKLFIFLEYAAGGELFNLIEPDIGMAYCEAQRYMRELLSGLQYLHVKGITHRDLKPENILLDAHRVLKISDFGMATIFRLKGKERLLDKRCGTLPYVAPEVLEKSYRAEPADLWSCGIILVTMLAGELPWDEPTDKKEEYRTWKTESGLLTTPWSKLETSALSLARKMLNPDPEGRLTIEQILQQPWMRIDFPIIKSTKSDSSECQNLRQSSMTERRKEYEVPTVALSQPAPYSNVPTKEELASLLQPSKQSKLVSFSQPTHNDDLILGSQIRFTQSPITQNNFDKLIKRMTRFFVKTSHEETITALCSALEKMHFTWSSDPSGVVTISTIYNRNVILVFKAHLISMDGKLLLHFCLTKGCGLEFKRRFVKLKAALSDIVLSIP